MSTEPLRQVQEPKCSNTGGRWKLEYEDARVKIDVSRLRDGRGHNPTAWFSLKAGDFSHTDDKSAPRAFKTAFKQDLASTRARDDAVRYGKYRNRSAPTPAVAGNWSTRTPG